MATEQRLSERLAILATIDPASHSSAQNTDVIDMRLWRRVAFIGVGGVIFNGTCSFVVNGDTASNGSFATQITDKSTSTSTFSGTVDNNTQFVLEVTSEEVQAQGFRYIRGTLTPGGAGIYAVVALGTGRYAPVAALDLASVEEIVA